MPVLQTKKIKDKRFKRRYLSKSQAKRYLQLDNNEFKRILIFKGTYPRIPKKLLNSQAKHKTYYSTKEIKRILDDPIIEKFREYHTHMKESSKLITTSKVSNRAEKPCYDLSSTILERYPTFTSALADISDPLSMVFLYSILPPAINSDTMIDGHAYLTTSMHEECQLISKRWRSIIEKKRALKRAFISIKGYYYEANFRDYGDRSVIWIDPHDFVSSKPSKAIEHRIMLCYLEFYLSLLKFVCFKLENDMLAREVEESNEIFTGANSEPPKLPPQDAKSQEEFEKLKFYVSRESNPKQLHFVLANLGCEIASDSTEPEVTHYVIDRPNISHDEERLAHVDYVQPQYVFDCLNKRMVLSNKGYGIGERCPPHLSPFTTEESPEILLHPTEESHHDLSSTMKTEEKVPNTFRQAESDSESEEIREKPFRSSSVAKQVNEQLNFSESMKTKKNTGNHKSDENFGLAQAAHVSKRVRELYKAAKHSQKIANERESNIQMKKAKIRNGSLGLSRCGRFLREKKNP